MSEPRARLAVAMGHLFLLLGAAGCNLVTQEDVDWRLDPDGDGVEFLVDCDEEDADVGIAQLRWPDADGDGEGDGSAPTEVCPDELGYVRNDRDCDDLDPTSWSEGEELCDGADNDCNGVIDDALGSVLFWPDGDGDGYGDAAAVTLGCELPEGSVRVGGDCDDTNAAVRPDALETCNEIDDDCDEFVDDLPPSYADDDLDGFGDRHRAVDACDPEGSATRDNTDCDDDDPDTYPGAPELCDDRDNDCDGEDEHIYIYDDADGDGDGSPGTYHTECPLPPSWSLTAGDCDDGDAARSSLKIEVCINGIDDNCDDVIDDTDWHIDGDGDGAGGGTSVQSCAPIVGYVANGWDCDDRSVAVPLYVDSSLGDDSNSGSATAPLASLAAAVAARPKCMVVRAGAYEGPLVLGDFALGIVAADGAASTTIVGPGGACSAEDTSGCASVLRMTGSATVMLEGFTLSGGTGTVIADPLLAASTQVACGGGVEVEAGTLELLDVAISANSLPEGTAEGLLPAVQSAGGALCVLGGTVRWSGGGAWGNEADLGGGVAAYGGTLELNQLSFAENTAVRGGAVWMAESTLDAAQVRIWCNSATDVGGAFYLADSSADASFEYLDLALDSAPESAEVGGVEGSRASLAGAAVYGDAVAALFDTAGGFWVDASVLNNASGEVYGTGSVFASGVLRADPEFGSVTCNGVPTDDDFTLRAGSPAIDAGPSAEVDADGSAADAGSNGGAGGAW